MVRAKQIAANVNRPVRLLGTVPGTSRDERRLHATFAAYAAGSEWFRPDADMLACIACFATPGSQAEVHPRRRSVVDSYKPLGRLNSEGLRLLHLEMDRRGWRGPDFAKAIGVDRASPHRWLWAKAKPGREIALRIESVFGVPLGAWSEAPHVPAT